MTVESEWWSVYMGNGIGDLLDIVHFRPAVSEAEARRRLGWNENLKFWPLDDR